MTFDLRFLNHQDRLATEVEWHRMMSHCKVPGIEVTLKSLPAMKEPMVCTNESLKLIQMVEDLARMLGFTVGHELTGGAGDAGYASKMGIPVLDGLGPVGGGDHSPSEYLRLDSVAQRGARLSGLMASIGSQH